MTDTVDEPRKSAKKTRGRPFQPGNPGKPPGARHRATRMAEQLMEGAAESVVQAVLAAAQNGDMVAARLVLDRIAPVRKGRPVLLPLSAVGSAADVVAALGAVVKAMGEGIITPDEAATVAGVLEVKRRAIESARPDLANSAVEDAKTQAELIQEFLREADARTSPKPDKDDGAAQLPR